MGAACLAEKGNIMKIIEKEKTYVFQPHRNY